MNKGKDPFKRPFDSLENLVDKIRDVLECPVTVEDANHRLLAYSTHDDQTDAARIATIISRKVPEKVINSLWKANAIPQLMKSGEPLKIPEIKEIGLGNRVAISIRNQNEVLGYIWAVERDKSLSEDEMNLLKLAAQTARTELLKLNRQKKKREESYQGFFWQLLTGRYPNHEEIIEKLEELNIKPPANFTVIVFRFLEDIDVQTEQSIVYLITTSQKLNITFYAAMGNEFIILASPSESQGTEKTIADFILFFIDQMKTRFQIHQIIGASSGLSERLEHVEERYSESLEVVRLKSKFPEEMTEIHTYNQLGIFRYLEELLEKKKSNEYEHPTIKKLIKYDLEHKTDLLNTLESFISHDSNVNEAAKKLHIHVNTLNYRLKRITDIGETDLKSTHQKLSLYLDLKMRKFMNRKHRL
ncbi:helix-turn-helix domain-containing protein [Cytobacillus purgationiresistens]|uniref:DNA-binding PucR family transcriptional regulator n=1 Tax=Cytobacillus purgationiresistens TaxID=863449 RepID=A0ABU0AHZ1_9BACI|nr:helix-turn-helix domain-containing protein [Cytobacillus purgationiresistens]MDQ0270869.1 DNA-binding PucR family transcriptional regulator [Cytobacillus purgationiresistens]